MFSIIYCLGSLIKEVHVDSFQSLVYFVYVITFTYKHYVLEIIYKKMIIQWNITIVKKYNEQIKSTLMYTYYVK